MVQSQSAFQATTIVAVRRHDGGAMAGDGQVTWGQSTVMKQTARKVRRLMEGKVIVGFAGSAADGLTLLEQFEEKLQSYNGQLQRAAVELVKQWRSDRVLRRLDALMLVMDHNTLLVLSGNGDIIEPDDGIVAIGSGGPFALAAARALAKHTQMPPAEIAEQSLRIAADICVFTNSDITLESIP